MAKVTATELSGRKVRFLTGVNDHPGEVCFEGRGYAGVWGVHPSDVSSSPIPIGGGIVYDRVVFPKRDHSESFIRLVSGPRSNVQTWSVTASTKEEIVNGAEVFEAFLEDLAARH